MNKDCDTCGSNEGATNDVQCLTCGGPVNVPLPANNEPIGMVGTVVLDQKDIAKIFEDDKA